MERLLRFAIAILLTVTGAQQSQLEGPENTVSFVGSNVTLKCLSPSRNCNGIEWLKLMAGSSVTVLNHRGIISSAYYSVDKSSGCHLVIKNVERTDAGRFLCRAFISSNTVEQTAYLIILETQPKCTTNASMDDTVEEDGVQLNCVMTYNDTNTTSMVWKGIEENKSTISGSYFVVASAPEVPSFTCITSLAVETKDKDGTEIKGLATNIPDITCATSAIKILYSVRNVTLSPSRSYYTSGNVINCAAKGHPSPTFKWQEMENGSTWMDIQNQTRSEFSMTNVSSKLCRCVAMNVVRGKSYNATSHEFLVNNTDSDYTDSFTATTVYPLPLNSTQLPSTVMVYIRVAVGVAVVFLLFITLLLICCCVRVCPGYKYRHSGNKSNDKISREQPLRENPDIYRNANQVGQQESAYASLGAQEDANEYMSLEQRQKAKAEKKSKP